VASSVSFVVLALYPLRTLLFGSERLSHGTVQFPGSFVNDLWNFVIPSGTTKFIPSFLAADSIRVTIGVESGGYIGLPILVICLITVVTFRRQVAVRTAAVTGLVLAVLSLGPRLKIDGSVKNIPLPFALLVHLPFLGNILAARFAGVTDLCVGVLLAFFVADLSRAAVGLRVVGGALLLFGLAIVTPAPLPLPTLPYSIPSYFTSASVDKIPFGSTALVAPWDADGTEQGPQLWQAASGFRFKISEGYVYVPTPSGPITGPVPNSLSIELQTLAGEAPTSANPTLSPADRRLYREEMRKMGVSSVLVGPMQNYAQVVSLFDQLLRRPGQVSGGVTAWYGIKV
jgi:hypothetical protein